jgi:hypothetical protein
LLPRLLSEARDDGWFLLEKDERGAGGGSRAVLRCVCDRRILCKVQPEGEHIGFLVFLDGEPTSGTYGQRVKSCPGCGKQLELSVLYLEN